MIYFWTVKPNHYKSPGIEFLRRRKFKAKYWKPGDLSYRLYGKILPDEIQDTINKYKHQFFCYIKWHFVKLLKN